MFWAPERPAESMESSKVGRWNTPSNLPTVQPAVSVSSKRVGFHGGTHTHQGPVPEGAVDAPDRGPDLVVAGPLGGDGRTLARVRTVPRVGRHLREGVRRGREHVVCPRPLAPRGPAELLAQPGEG